MSGGDSGSQKTAISTDLAPAAVGPYSQAIRVGDLLFVSGQLPLDPAAPGDPAPDSFGRQTEMALSNLRAVVEASGLGVDDIARTTIYVTDLSRFDEVNQAYASFFSGVVPPARCTVEVAALPKNVGVEIDAIAYAAAVGVG
ncbi:Rid family detoxifying hydrolase [Microbacterium sp. SSM24]|uniref:Rid family detoxifying hydrolase n=1 Tax=Microbacterium sp. SSM24 TaxID=2991714 RepID=UPI002226CB4B|nr:Rid family detoxifying hydrolase [Microbacterium sp. SSM24]MCW3492608.1 Rid family detoxifying hydrolase [Microbacterium sp. SSM24]